MSVAQAQAAGIPADKLLRDIGVDTQMPYTDGAYANVAQVISDLHYVGVCNVRDGISNGFDPWTGAWNGSAAISTFQQMAASCVRFTFLFASGGAISPAFLQSQFGLMQQVEAATPGSIAGFEILNEVSNFNISWNGDTVTTCDQEYSDTLAAQAYAYAMIRAVPALNRIPVLLSTGFDSWDTTLNCPIAIGPDIRKVKGLANRATAHPYPSLGAAPNDVFKSAVATLGTTAPDTYTEWGYSTSGGVYSGVNEDVQMRYGLDGAFDAASVGTPSFMFALLDAYAPGSRQGDQYWGLFDYTGAPKPIATALHNLHAIVHDHGEALAPLLYPNFTASGLPATGKTLPLGRRDGAVMEAVWAEPPLWDPAAGQELPITAAPVTISLGQSYATAQLFDPTQSQRAIQTWTNVSQVTIMVGASPMIIKAH